MHEMKWLMSSTQEGQRQMASGLESWKVRDIVLKALSMW